MTNRTSSNDIYYFLGNITSHILHALPLYRKLGGTFVVLSDKARQKVEKLYDVPVIAIDNSPYQWHRFGYKIKPIHEYGNITKKHRKTIDFLNKNAKVVLFYELFDFDSSVRINRPTTIFLTHGNMLKDYMGENERMRKLGYYDYMAALGPLLKERFVEKGIPSEKLIDIGVARTDDVIEHQGQIIISPELKKLLGKNADRPIVTYLPTFWGPSSIYNTGRQILSRFPGEYTLLFRPHPHTPQKLLTEYLRLIEKHDNLYYLPEGRFKDISLVDIFNASRVIIGDVSSVMLEAILTRKPLIFAYDDSSFSQTGHEYALIAEVVKKSSHIDTQNIDEIDSIIRHGVSHNIDHRTWDKAITQNFYHADGTSVESIAQFIEERLARG